MLSIESGGGIKTNFLDFDAERFEKMKTTRQGTGQIEQGERYRNGHLGGTAVQRQGQQGESHTVCRCHKTRVQKSELHYEVERHN